MFQHNRDYLVSILLRALLTISTVDESEFVCCWMLLNMSLLVLSADAGNDVNCVLNSVAHRLLLLVD